MLHLNKTRSQIVATFLYRMKKLVAAASDQVNMGEVPKNLQNLQTAQRNLRTPQDGSQSAVWCKGFCIDGFRV